MQHTIEAVTPATVHFVHRFEQLAVDGVDPEEVINYLFAGPGLGRLLFAAQQNTVFGHFLYRLDHARGLMLVDRFVLHPEWESLWMRECLENLKTLVTTPVQGPSLVPTLWAPLHARTLHEGLKAGGWWANGESENYFGQEAYEFTIPLDDFSPAYIASRAKKVRKAK